MRKYLFLTAISGLFACAPLHDLHSTDSIRQKKIQPGTTHSGLTFIEEVVPAAGKTLIPYKKYLLSNGLTVILHEDSSDPLVHVDVTYHVGSSRERLGQSGFAHFFEHMMFQGSENVADEQHFKLVTAAGGRLNGSTSRDRTNYYQTVPANHLERMLWLEADRMGFLLDAVTPEKFEIQRETVKNERAQRVDDVPYGRLQERVAEALYSAEHPYSWPVIGYVEDLDRVGVDDLKAFFLRWYGPNNATLSVGGAINVEQALDWVVKYFGGIPRGADVASVRNTPIFLEKDRYVSFQDNVHLPLLFMAYPTTYLRHQDEAPLDLLARILGAGKTSLFYENLVKSGVAINASVSHPCGELACQFNLYALPNPASGQTLADVESAVRDTLDQFERHGVDTADLRVIKAEIEADFIFGLQSVAGKISQLAANETYSGNPNFIEQDIARYNAVTPDDVMRVFQRYIKGRSGVIMSVVPMGQADAVASPDNFICPKRTVGSSVGAIDHHAVLDHSQDDFDRSLMPETGPSMVTGLPALWRHDTANGMSMLGAQSYETPTTSLLLRIPAGQYYADTKKAGITALMADMLHESTLQRSAKAMSRELKKLGSSISISADTQYLNVSVNALTKNLVETLDLMNEKLWRPAWIPEEFERAKNRTVELVHSQQKELAYRGMNAYRQLLYGNTIASMPSSGYPETLENVSLQDLKVFYQRHVQPYGAHMIVVSDLSKAHVLDALTSFDDWTGSGPRLDLQLPASAAHKGIVYLVNREGAEQSILLMGKRTLKKDIAGEYYRATLMNFALGGAFNSRINLNLREDKGYTYGARSYFSGDRFAGNFTARAQVRADVTAQALTEMKNEIQHYANLGVSAEELSFMRSAISQKEALKYETPRAKMGLLAQMLAYDLDLEFVSKRAKIVENVSRDEINMLAKKHLQTNDMVTVIVGDAKTITPSLTSLGYSVVPYAQ